MPSAYDHQSDPRFVAYYENSSQSLETQERFARVMTHALSFLSDSGREGPFDVVDIGAGAGTQALLWASRGHRVRALDVNEQLISIGRRRAADAQLSVRFDVASATALPYEDSSADVVLIPQLLEHVPEWERCLEEIVRVSRPGCLVYISTTNWLCPAQSEFELPLYSWYPPPLKRWCERKAVSTHPHWVNHARYPAVHWFSYYQLARWLRSRGFMTFDRFDMLARRQLPLPQKSVVTAVRAVPPLRVLAHMFAEDATVWAQRA